jgi:hypothetical protein
MLKSSTTSAMSDGVPLEQIDGRRSAVRQQNCVPVTFEGPFHHLAHEFFVIHHEDRSGALGRARPAAAGRSSAARAAAGNSTVKQLPLPGALLTEIALCDRAGCRQRPPVPALAR